MREYKGTCDMCDSGIWGDINAHNCYLFKIQTKQSQLWDEIWGMDIEHAIERFAEVYFDGDAPEDLTIKVVDEDTDPEEELFYKVSPEYTLDWNVTKIS